MSRKIMITVLLIGLCGGCEAENNPSSGIDYVDINTGPSDDRAPNVAFDGTNYLVAYQENSASTKHDIFGIMINPAGVRAVSAFAIDNTSNDDLAPVVAFDGTNYLVVYERAIKSTDHDIMGAFVTKNGTGVGGGPIVPFSIDSTSNDDRAPAVAFDGTNYLVVYERTISSTPPEDHDIMGALVSPAGVKAGLITNFGAGTSPSSVAIGDFNGDGKPDLAVANAGSGNVSILLGNGLGSFGAATNFPVGTSPSSVAIGDFNGDLKPDLAVANAVSNNVSILLGNGLGSFGAATNFPVGTSPSSVAIGDFNGDGKSDLAVANAGSNSVSILLGTGTGSFGAAANFAVGTGPSSVAIGKLDGNTSLDLAVANSSNGSVSILLGTGTGSFSRVFPDLTVGTSPSSVAIGDIDGDTSLDLAVANSGSNNVSILLGTGTGSFRTAMNFAVGTGPCDPLLQECHASVAIGDIDGDSKLDLAVANSSSGNVSVILRTGTGSFRTAMNFAVGTGPSSVAIGSLNGNVDGNLDLAIANSGNNDVSILLQTAVGFFGTLVIDSTNNSITVLPNDDRAPAVASDEKNNSLVVYQRTFSSTDHDIIGAFFSPSGVSGGPFTINFSFKDDLAPTVAFERTNGTNYLVVYQRTVTSGNHDIIGTRVDPTDNTVDVVLIDTSDFDDRVPAVAFDGTNYLVVYQEENTSTDHNITGRRVDQGGNVLGHVAIDTSRFDDRAPAVAFGAANYFVVYEEVKTVSDYGIFGALVPR